MYFFVVLLVFICIWCVAVYKTNDFKVKNRNISNFKKILIIFPHPDDESLSVSGLTRIAKDKSINTTLLVLTQGEAGEAYKSDKSKLGDVRTEELKKSARIIGVNKLMQFTLPDGKLNRHQTEIKKIISENIEGIKPDLIITYDLSGLYGHEDHIITSNIVTDLVLKKYKDIKLWYVSYPKKVLDMISLPTHMAKDKEFIKKRCEPNLKVFKGLNFIYSYLSVLAHKSQYKSFRSEELRFIPLILAYSTQIYEYFYEVN